ncbi:MAG TPA: GrpB family protein [Bdellovibrionota bacterium]|nr:GrpB family protein [Bdellovibrionota bacterium]
MSKSVVVENYDAAWAKHFVELKALLWPAVQDFAISIEHVGSTSVPGLAAKPVIDIDIVIPDMSSLNLAIQKLSALGYEHRGDLGIKDREAFRTRSPLHAHHLYVCPQNSIALKNHLCLREALKGDTKLRDEYASLKFDLATRFPTSIDDYIEGKTAFILKILQSHGYGPDSLEAIRIANLAPASRNL